jgi:hypothetical protein
MGALALPYTLVVQYGALTGTFAAYYGKMVGLAVLSVLNMGSLHTKPLPYDF